MTINTWAVHKCGMVRIAFNAITQLWRECRLSVYSTCVRCCRCTTTDATARCKQKIAAQGQVCFVRHAFVGVRASICFRSNANLCTFVVWRHCQYLTSRQISHSRSRKSVWTQCSRATSGILQKAMIMLRILKYFFFLLFWRRWRKFQNFCCFPLQITWDWTLPPLPSLPPSSSYYMDFIIKFTTITAITIARAMSAVLCINWRMPYAHALMKV